MSALRVPSSGPPSLGEIPDAVRGHFQEGNYGRYLLYCLGASVLVVGCVSLIASLQFLRPRSQRPKPIVIYTGDPQEILDPLGIADVPVHTQRIEDPDSHRYEVHLWAEASEFEQHRGALLGPMLEAVDDGTLEPDFSGRIRAYLSKRFDTQENRTDVAELVEALNSSNKKANKRTADGQRIFIEITFDSPPPQAR